MRHTNIHNRYNSDFRRIMVQEMPDIADFIVGWIFVSGLNYEYMMQRCGFQISCVSYGFSACIRPRSLKTRLNSRPIYFNFFSTTTETSDIVKYVAMLPQRTRKIFVLSCLRRGIASFHIVFNFPSFHQSCYFLMLHSLWYWYHCVSCKMSISRLNE